ncbi:MAG: hypothetical protein ABIJ09_25680 [Pseudomonadota bacterium]
MITSTPSSNRAKHGHFGIGVGILVALFLLEVVPASATTLKALSIPELAARSVAVVRVRVRHQRCEWRRNVIVTVSQVEVLEVLQGEAASGLEVMQLGGQIEDHAMPVVGSAELFVDEEAVLFLLHNPERPGEYHVTGMSQGALHVIDGDRLRWAPTAMLWDGRSLQAPMVRHLSLAELRRQLRGAP